MHNLPNSNVGESYIYFYRQFNAGFVVSALVMYVVFVWGCLVSVCAVQWILLR
jgi:hypothetical protein